ncbi:MAG: hypothetical protein D6795_02425 [Deltaproteobacteria bacterium]|nr:MAG: hypothetical protein D6795_02425 [Deltaproteobacteria bacterium]
MTRSCFCGFFKPSFFPPARGAIRRIFEVRRRCRWRGTWIVREDPDPVAMAFPPFWRTYLFGTPWRRPWNRFRSLSAALKEKFRRKVKGVDLWEIGLTLWEGM